MTQLNENFASEDKSYVLFFHNINCQVEIIFEEPRTTVSISTDSFGETSVQVQDQNLKL